jgi:hypothetical protein
MATRSDFEVNFEVSPRLIDITSASEEVSVQDSHDTLSDIQDSAEGGQFEFLVSTAGGEDLGGGTSVGLTTVLNNVQYAFQTTSPIETGTVTTGSSTSLIDSAATFQTNLVKRGDWIINFTDQSVTEVLEVVSETELLTRGLRDGTGNTFDISDAYKVWEVKEAELVGGNFTAVDDLDADMSPVFPVFGRTFTRTASSSATASSQLALESGLLAGRVVIDVLSGYSGTERNINGDLIGTHKAPSNNVPDAVAIANNNGIRTLFIQSNLTINEDLSGGFVLQGVSPIIEVTANPAANLTGATVENVAIFGELDGLNIVTHCGLDGISDVSGLLEQSSLRNTVHLNGDVLFFKCISNVAGGGYPRVFGGTGIIIQVRDFHGSFGLENVVDGSHSIEGSGGRCVVESTCTGGTLHVRGKWFEIVDNSGAGCTVLDEREGFTDIHTAKLDGVHGQVRRDIHIDTELVAQGNGYQQTPYNDWSLAVDDAEANNIRHLIVLSDATVDRQLKNFTIDGVGVPVIDLNDQIMDNTIIERCRLTGGYSGVMQGSEVRLVGVSGVNGTFLSVAVAGTLTVADNSEVLMSRIVPAMAGQPWTINMNGALAPAVVALHNTSGGIIVDNMQNAGDVLHILASQGTVTINNTCTAGEIVIGGLAAVVDNSAGVSVVLEFDAFVSIKEMHDRLDLNVALPNIYANDGSSITNADFTLTNTDNGNGTSTVQRS